jgi:RNA-binding protein
VSGADRLTGTQRKYLRGLAHSLSPVVHVGNAGLTDAVIAAASRALDEHELIKVKIAAERDERSRIAAELEEGCRAHLAGEIGTIAILYRAHRDPEKRKVMLPARAAAPE